MPDVSAIELPTLTYADVNCIKVFAAIVQRKTAYGSIPEHLTIGGIEAPTRSVTPRNALGATLGDTELRALYSPTLKDIQVCCAGVEIAKSTRALDHIICVMRHEALHATQYPHFLREQIEEASGLNKKAKESPDAYQAYITCDVELPAHPVMIALELRQEDPPDFDKAARRTASYGYFSERLKGAVKSDAALQRLVASTQEMHPNLRPPKLETESD